MHFCVSFTDSDPHDMDDTTSLLARPISSDDSSTDNDYVMICSSDKNVAHVNPDIIQQIKHQRKLIRLAMRTREGMYQSDSLGISIWFEPETIVTPPVSDIIVGISENEPDLACSGRRSTQNYPRAGMYAS